MTFYLLIYSLKKLKYAKASDSETKIRSALKELKKFGYYVTEKIKDEKGRYQPTKHYFYESVQLNTNEDADEENDLFSSPCPRLDFPYVDSPMLNQQTDRRTPEFLIQRKIISRNQKQAGIIFA